MDSALKCPATLAAGDFARKGIAVLVLFMELFYSFLHAALFNDCLSCFKIFMTDNRLMMVFYQILIFLAEVIVAVEVIISIGLLKNSIT